MAESSQADVINQRLQSWIGVEDEPSPWVLITQQDIDAFGDLTHDHNYIHVDPERSAKESPYGTTIAHGFLTLSLLPHMITEMPLMEDHPYASGATMVNYGFDKLRFISPVKVGSRVRARRTLVNARRKGSNWVLLSYDMTVDIENEPKPALAGTWLILMVCQPDEES